MLERPGLRDSIFSQGSTARPRPVSVATEFMEDWEVDDEGVDTEIEDEAEENSPRVSLNSVCLLPPFTLCSTLLMHPLSRDNPVLLLSRHTTRYRRQAR
jgi:hypothetical protein